VQATSAFRIVDEGTEKHGDVEYNNESAAHCKQCAWAGTWVDLTTKANGDCAV
jgi:hypothetical protein